MGPSIFVVAAESALRERLLRELSAAGCRARAGSESAAALQASQPDLVIVDVDAPDGFDRLGALASHVGGAPVLALTAAGDAAAADRVRTLGACSLAKPVDGLRLLSHVRRLIDRAASPGAGHLSVAAAPAASGAAASARPVHRILSVEDVAVNQELVRLVLDDGAYAIDRVADGDTALTALRDMRYDLMLLDLRLPGIGGLELARLVRCTEGAGPRLPIIAVTADIAPQTVAAAYAVGVDEVLAKPFTAVALRAAVARRLGLVPPAGSHEPSLPESAVQTAGAELTGTLERIGRLHGQPIVGRLLSSFMSQLAQMAEMEDGDGPGVGARAHAVKGAAAGLGFADVTLACGDLEIACRTGQNVRDRLRAASSTCERVRGEIEARLMLAA